MLTSTKKLRRVSWRLCVGSIVFIASLLGLTPVVGAKTHREVLIIYSWHDLLPWQAGLRRGLQDALDQMPEEQRPDVYEERIDAGRVQNAVSDDALYRYLKEKYDRIALDSVITEGQRAADFLLHHPDLFPKTQRNAVNLVRDVRAMEGMRAFPFIDDHRKALLSVTEVMPGCEHIFVIADNSEVGERNKKGALENAAFLPPHVKLEIWENLSFDELFARASNMPTHSAILFYPLVRDRNGVSRVPRDVVTQLSRVANGPVFGLHDTFLGYGIVGGFLSSSRKEGALIAQIAMDGTANVPMPSSDANAVEYRFDDVQLQRWGIPDSRLPTPFTVMNREEPAWARYRLQIGLGLTAIALEALLILALFYMMRQRKIVSQELQQERDSLERRVNERTAELRDAMSRVEESNRKLEELATTDELTKVANRRKFLEFGQAEMNRALRYDRQMSVLMLGSLQKTENKAR